MKEDQEYHTPEETEQRLRKTLKAAFNMKPTPLKSIRARGAKGRVAHKNIERRDPKSH